MNKFLRGICIVVFFFEAIVAIVDNIIIQVDYYIKNIEPLSINVYIACILLIGAILFGYLSFTDSIWRKEN